MQKHRRLLIIFLLLSFILQGCSAVSETTSVDDSAYVKLYALNVGKADALILQVGSKNYLIDTGTSKTFDSLKYALNKLNITHLDAVILTHTDKDHGGGMKKLSKSDISVSEWYASKYYIDKTPDKHQAYLAASLHNKEPIFLMAGDVIQIDEASHFSVIGPISFDSDSENSNSLVMILHTPEGKIFFAADMEHKEELEVIRSGAVEQCEVLKVAHHGEGDATSLNLAATVRPQVAIISTSTQEEKDTPDKDVLRILNTVNAQIAVTQDAKGGVLVTLRNGTATTHLFEFN